MRNMSIDNDGYTSAITNATTHTETHNLGYKPQVEVEDSSGNDIGYELVHDSVNQFTLTFPVAFTGTVKYK